LTDDTLLPFDLPSVQRKKLTVDLAAATSRRMPVCCCCERRSASSVCVGGLRGRWQIAAIREAIEINVVEPHVGLVGGRAPGGIDGCAPGVRRNFRAA
jgi:hypothetical protein